MLCKCLFELQHIEADYQLQSSEIGHFITLSGRRVFEFYSELADLNISISSSLAPDIKDKSAICNDSLQSVVFTSSSPPILNIWIMFRG